MSDEGLPPAASQPKLRQAVPTRLTSQARFWNNGLYSDVRLQLLCMVPQNAQGGNRLQLSGSSKDSDGSLPDDGGEDRPGGDSSRAKVPRRSSEATTAPESASAAAVNAAVGAGSRTYHLHAVTLASASGHFRSLMPLCSAAAAPAGSAGSAAAVPLQLVEHVEEGELDAMEAVLRHCYTGELCEEGGDARELSVAMLVQMMVLANRFDVPICMAHSCLELSRRGNVVYDVPSINTLMAGGVTAWGGLEMFDYVEYNTDMSLAHLFGDAEAVCCGAHDGGSNLHTQLLQLSPGSLQSLLCDQLEGLSDNTVLMMVDAWTAGEAGVGCSGGEKRRHLAERIALGRLSHTFVRDVLPALPWLGLSAAEHASLVRFSAAAAVGGAGTMAGSGLSRMQQALVEGGRLAGPSLWYGPALAQWSQTEVLEFEWEVTREQLVQQLRQLNEAGTATPLLFSRWHFHNGYSLRMVLGVVLVLSGVEGADKQGGARVGLEVAVRTSGGAVVTCPSVALSARCGVRGWKDGEGAWVSDAAVGWDGLADSEGGGLLQLNRVPGPQVGDLAAWAPYLVKQVVTLRCTVDMCA